jgi:hypothetical protein
MRRQAAMFVHLQPCRLSLLPYNGLGAGLPARRAAWAVATWPEKEKHHEEGRADERAIQWSRGSNRSPLEKRKVTRRAVNSYDRDRDLGGRWPYA